jgi:preprotein translocase subunit SecE
MKKITNHFQESLRELTDKVSWPTWTQLQQSTMIVLAATLFITLIVLAMDSLIGTGFKFIYKQLF